MAIRISTITEPHGTVVKVDGRLQIPDVEELQRMIQQLEGPAELDLTELHAVDRSAAALLRDLIEMGVTLRAASPYVRLLLENDPQQSQHAKKDNIPKDEKLPKDEK